MTRDSSLSSLTLYRWSNPETTCDYPYLALAEDHSVCLWLGNYRLSFEWGLSDQVAAWLAFDFTRTDGALVGDFATLRHLCDSIFGGVTFGVVSFDAELKPDRVQLSLEKQVKAEDGPEYLVWTVGNYQRINRETNRVMPVAPPERAVLDVCTSTFAELAAQRPEIFKESPPPHYRSPSSRQPLQ
jgi:hypothetical protein